MSHFIRRCCLSQCFAVAYVLIGLYVDARLSPFTACTRCSGPTFEAKQCRGREDSECFHISRPFFDTTLSIHKYQVMEDRYGFSFVHSGNIFMEDLLRTSTLVHDVRVGNRQQFNSFPWNRSEHVKMWITVKDNNLLPEYEDVDYLSDNDFYRNDSESGSSNILLKNMAEIRKGYCRHPIPDWYTIFMHVYPSRTTAVEHKSCAETRVSTPPCPEDYTESDSYQFRSVNKKCRRLSQEGHLQSNPNSFLCTANSPLLNRIFNRTIHDDFLSFPTDKKCVESSFQCSNCLRDRSKCKSRTSGRGYKRQASPCCGINCFSTQWCKNYYRKECVSLESECATGDTMRFTLQPSFKTVREGGFMCHVRYVSPKILYRLSYNVTIYDKDKNVLWVSRPVHKVVKSDGSRKFHEEHRFYLDNIEVKHMTFTRLLPEYILRGQKIRRSRRSSYDFTRYNLKGPHDFEKGPITVFKQDANARMSYVDIQLSRPFMVSTSSWINHWCFVNISNFHRNQTMYKPSSGKNILVERFRMPYDPQKRYFDRKKKEMRFMSPPPIQYFIRQEKTNPSVRFAMAGSKSILKPHFCRDHPYNRIHRLDDLQAKLVFQPENKWTIALNGLVNATPSYLHVRLTEARSRALILNYDVIVLGSHPKFFINYSFLLPPVGGRRDADFELAVDDCIRTRRIFLASFSHRQLSRRRYSFIPEGATLSDNIRRNMYPNGENSEAISVMGNADNQQQPYFVLLLLTLAVGAVYLLLLVVYGVLRFCRRPHRYSHEELFPNHHHHHHHYHQHRNSNVDSNTETQAELQQQRLTSVSTRRRPTSLSTRRKIFLMSYLVFRVFYNFLFTFSAITSVIFSLQSVAMTTLESTASHQSALRDRFRVQFDNLEAFGSRELKRQVDFAQTLSSACNHIIGSTLGNSTIAMRQISMSNIETTLTKGHYTIANQTGQKFKTVVIKFRETMEAFLDAHKRRMVNNLKNNYSPYGAFLRKVYQTPWLRFPQGLFNKSKSFSDSLFDVALRPSTLKKIHVDFLTFLGISEAEKLHLLPSLIWKSLDRAFPKPPNKLPQVPKNKPLPLWRSQQSNDHQSLSMSHSKRFFSTPDDQPLRSPTDQVFGSNREQIPNKEDSTSHSKELTFDSRIISIRLYLFVLDLVIVLYRFYHTYRTARVLYTGRRVRLTEAELVSITHSTSATSFASVNTLLTSRESTPTATANQHAHCNIQLLQQHLGPSQQIPNEFIRDAGLTRNPDAADAQGAASGLSIPSPEDDAVPCLTSMRQSCFFTVHYLAVVVTAGMALLTFFCLIHTDRSLHVPTLLHRGGFLRRLDTLESSRRLVNQIIHAQAYHLNAKVLPNLKQQGDEMSRRLVSLQHRFQHEQLHFNLLYHAESCTIDRNRCDSSPRLLHTVDSPVPTCNVIKILADNFTEFMNPFSISNYGYFRDYQHIRRSLLADGSVMPEVAALRNLLFTSITVLFTTLAAIGVLHLLGGLCLRWTHLPLRPTRITKLRPSSIAALTGSGHSHTDASPLLRPHQRDSVPTVTVDGQTSLTQESRV